MFHGHAIPGLAEPTGFFSGPLRGKLWDWDHEMSPGGSEGSSLGKVSILSHLLKVLVLGLLATKRKQMTTLYHGYQDFVWYVWPGRLQILLVHVTPYRNMK